MGFLESNNLPNSAMLFDDAHTVSVSNLPVSASLPKPTGASKTSLALLGAGQPLTESATYAMLELSGILILRSC